MHGAKIKKIRVIMYDKLQRIHLWDSIEVFLLSGNFLEMTTQNQAIITGL
jgi:hypothetical protein